MDKGSFKRVVLFGGLLFCVIIGNVVFMLAWADTVRTQDEEMLGQLILMKPQDEKGYVSVMRGNRRLTGRPPFGWVALQMRNTVMWATMR